MKVILEINVDEEKVDPTLLPLIKTELEREVKNLEIEFNRDAPPGISATLKWEK